MRSLLFLTAALMLIPVAGLWAKSRDRSVVLQDSVSSALIPYPMSEQARRSLRALLADSAKTGWRLVVASDNTDPYLDDWKQEFDKTYEPYFLQADFDGDGRQDFLIALVKEGLFEVFFFRSSGDKGYAPPERIVQLDRLDRCGFFAKEGRRLQIGGFYGDDLLTFSWNRSKHAMEFEPQETEE